MEKASNGTKAIGIMHVVIFLAMTITGGLLIVDQPITRQTSSALKIENLMVCAFLSAGALASILSIVVTFFLGLMFPGRDNEAANWFTSNPVSKALCYLAALSFAIMLIIGGLSSLKK